jgi:hypothetical protein
MGYAALTHPTKVLYLIAPSYLSDPLMELQSNIVTKYRVSTLQQASVHPAFNQLKYRELSVRVACPQDLVETRQWRYFLCRQLPYCLFLSASKNST